jgi:hypothetical protein
LRRHACELQAFDDLLSARNYKLVVVRSCFKVRLDLLQGISCKPWLAVEFLQDLFRFIGLTVKRVCADQVKPVEPIIRP